ncbi:hypothetical protein OG394_11290 [Kribbella sp. NBC_01245]|uniref:hypothetical protein n=1 Tax=Kribbella sp. NBC_01245 TaxID=2903578 RepID=UPI002E2AA977|nr:hypothetical protein [Kribbella sp. NBC_01245]
MTSLEGGATLPYCVSISKYDPADRDEHWAYIGPEEPISDHGPVEAAYLKAVAAFAAELGVERLTIREPGLTSINFGLEPTIEGHGLIGLFPADLTGFHDGAEVSLEVALELVRAMMRDNGAFCSLEVAGRLEVSVGYDQYVRVLTSSPCESAIATTYALGLFPDARDPAIYAIDDEDTVYRPADDEFWKKLVGSVAAGEAGLLEEMRVYNRSTWCRLNGEGVDLAAIRAGLRPRARLTVWPPLSTDLDAVRRAATAAEWSAQIMWQDADGRIVSTYVDEIEDVDAVLANARAALCTANVVDERIALYTAIVPDGDGVVRVLRGMDPTEDDRRWAERQAPPA